MACSAWMGIREETTGVLERNRKCVPSARLVPTKMTHLSHPVDDALISPASGAALRDESLPHASEAVGVDHTEFLMEWTPYIVCIRRRK